MMRILLLSLAACFLVVMVSSKDLGENVVTEFMECTDSVPEQCEKKLKPYFCYNYFNRKLCCNTCRQLRADSDICPYGDQPIVKWRDGRKYTCETYVAKYGAEHCKHSKKFRLQCCKTCPME